MHFACFIYNFFYLILNTNEYIYFFLCSLQAICLWYFVGASTAAVGDSSSAASTLGGLYREARDGYYRSAGATVQDRPQQSSRCISCLYAALGGSQRDDRDDRDRYFWHNDKSNPNCNINCGTDCT